MSGQRCLVLTGFMGSGKTTLAKKLAREHRALWFDSDAALLRRADVSTVGEMFAAGQERFRALERDVIAERAQLELAMGCEVWSLGAGAIADSGVRSAVESATVVWLDASPELLWEICAGTDRPLARSRDDFLRLYEQRRQLYDEISDVRLDARDAEAVERLARRWFAERSDDGVILADGAIREIGSIVQLQGVQVAVVADEAVSDAADLIVASLRNAGSDPVDVSMVPMGEWNKELSTAESLVRRWHHCGLHRDGIVVAVGGGTLLDTAGFAASIYRRGVSWVAVPTTLLAQVDASVGGKTAVNLAGAKNAVGSFHTPLAVLIDPDARDGEPQRATLDGLAELAKTALLAGGPDLTELDDSTENIAAAVRFKQRLCAADPTDDRGLREQLNLGHTFAHALEAATGNVVSHGHAVACGVNAALELSTRVLGLDGAVAKKYRERCAQLGLRTTCEVPFSELEPWLVSDKKHTAQGQRWVLLQAPGSPVSRVIEPRVAGAAWDDVVVRLEHETVPQQTGREPRVLVAFGVNLGELGRREPQHYGSSTLAELVGDIQRWARELGMRADCRQTDNLERFLGWIHEAQAFDALVLNPGAWTHTERALADALSPLDVPSVEVHLSDPKAREPWRHVSIVEPDVDHSVTGAGPAGYRHALEWLAQRLQTSRAGALTLDSLV